MAVTGYVAGVRLSDVVQVVAASVATHSAVAPEVKVTVPVAPAGIPKAETVSVEPYTMDAGDAVSVRNTSVPW